MISGLILGLLLSAWGLWLFNRKKRWIASCGKATGTIVSIETKREHKSDGRITHTNYPIVEFEYGGKTIRFQNEVGGTSYTETGKEVEIYFRMSNPEDAKINTFMSIWLLEFVVLLLGLGFLSGFVFAYFFQA